MGKLHSLILPPKHLNHTHCQNYIYSGKAFDHRTRNVILSDSIAHAYQDQSKSRVGLWAFQKHEGRVKMHVEQVCHVPFEQWELCLSLFLLQWGRDLKWIKGRHILEDKQKTPQALCAHFLVKRSS